MKFLEIKLSYSSNDWISVDSFSVCSLSQLKMPSDDNSPVYAMLCPAKNNKI